MKIMRQWPVTIVVRSRVFMDMVLDICTSALDMGFEKLVILNCHGRHAGLLNTAPREMSDAFNKGTAFISPAALSRDEFDAVRKSAHEGAIHAGEWETSLVLQISPEVVDMSKATGEDAMRYHSEFVAGTTSRGDSASHGRRDSFKAARPEPTAILPSLAPRRAESPWTYRREWRPLP
jgi:creatinine amidohydrolase